MFVSYKAEDRARLKPLVAALVADGFSIWWDAHIGAGSHWREDIQEHLDGAKCIDALTLMTRPAEARAEYQKVPTDDVFRLAGEAILDARSGKIAAMERTLAHMRELFSDAATYNYAQIYSQARDNDRAFDALDKAQVVKDAGLTGLKTDPFLDPIRRDPRYTALLQSLDFPSEG